MRMKQLKNIFLTLLLLMPLVASAQSEIKNTPDLQTANDGFFDPTRKEKPKREAYKFACECRIEAGYIQNDQRAHGDTLRYTFLHGARVGATFQFLLPYRFSLQTGLHYSISAGRSNQHWRSMTQETVQTEYLRHTVVEHDLTIPVRAYYTIPLWKKLNMFFYTGPQLQIGLAETDKIETHLSAETEAWLRAQGIPVDSYDKMAAGEISRLNIQYGLGGGLEWDCYRLQAGYDFGLNDLQRKGSFRMWEWQWNVVFSYRF